MAIQERKRAVRKIEKLDYLRRSFSDLTNYQAKDPSTPIDPMTYRTPEDDSCLHLAAMRGDDLAARYLVELGADINELGDMANTPLHYAKMFGNLSIVELLLTAGASTNIKNEFGDVWNEK